MTSDRVDATAQIAACDPPADPFEEQDVPRSACELLILASSQPVFCPSAERVARFHAEPDNPELIDVWVHRSLQPCPFCVPDASTISTPNSPRQRRKKAKSPSPRHPDASAVRREIDSLLEAGSRFYERLIEKAGPLCNRLPDITVEDLLNKVLVKLYARIERTGFRPKKNWEAFLLKKMKFAVFDLLGERMLLRKDELWAVAAARPSARIRGEEETQLLRDRRIRQYRALHAALDQSFDAWAKRGEPGSAERQMAILMKAVFERILRGTRVNDKLTLKRVADELGVEPKMVYRVNRQARAEFLERLQSSDLSLSQLRSIIPDANIGPKTHPAAKRRKRTRKSPRSSDCLDRNTDSGELPGC
jgi:hypothetical protein